MKKTLLHILIIIVVCVCGAVCAQAAPKFTAAEGKVLNDASKQIDSGNYNAAYNLLNEYIQKNNPVQAEFYFLLGTTQYFRKEYARAFEALQKSVSIDPQNADAIYNLGNVAYELGRYSQAGKYLEQAYNMRKDKTAEMCYAAAAAYYQAKDYAGAVRMCQKMIAGGSVFQKAAYVELAALSLMEGGQSGAAKKLMQDALNRSPGNIRYWQILANVGLAANDYATLAMALEVSYALQPPKREKWLELGNVYLYINAQARALQCLQKGYGDTADIKALRRMAQTAQAAGLFERALDYLDKAADAAPGNAEKAQLYLEKAFALYDRGLWSRAMESFRACTVADNAGKYAEALLFTGYCQVELGKIEAAKQTFKRAQERERVKANATAMLDMLAEMYPPDEELAPQTDDDAGAGPEEA